jgi:hydrogenase/urease accessory protein HupE
MRVAPAPLLAAALLLAAGAANAHEVRPGYLELRETSPGVFEVLFKMPMLGGMRFDLRPVLPAGCRSQVPATTYETHSAVLERWTVACDTLLAGQTISIQGLSGTLIEVLVRIETRDGRTIVQRLKPTAPSFVVPAVPSAWQVARTYFVLGVEHILGGVDHLLFVLALMLIVPTRLVLLKTITAFTVAHSITLALATLGAVHAPGRPVEATIALSVVFLAAELAHLRQGRPGLTSRAPWLVAFTFGLLHGLGFAGALAEIGLPERQIPVALLQFNVGVELGQLLFVAAVLAVSALARRLAVPWPARAWRLPAYGIGATAAFWAVQRTVSFWTPW